MAGENLWGVWYNANLADEPNRPIELCAPRTGGAERPPRMADRAGPAAPKWIRWYERVRLLEQLHRVDQRLQHAECERNADEAPGQYQLQRRRTVLLN